MSTGTKGEGSSWANLPVKNILPRMPEAVGVRCAADGCPATKGITYDKPLCYEHWKEFDAYRLWECERCHWFDDSVTERNEGEACCHQCFDRKRRGFPPTPVYAHGPVERHIQYLYILKLDGGKFYVGQTKDLEIRLKEHLDGLTLSTRGEHPKLVWFDEYVGDREELNAEEARLTRQAINNPRAIRRRVAEWQRPLRLVDFDA